MFEKKNEAIASDKEFRKRLTIFIAIDFFLLVFSLFIGIIGYHILGGLDWIDSFLNASMILGGMGPVDPVKTTAGKLFASFYALFSGIVFLVAVGVIFAPLFHRFLHKFHLAEDDKQKVK